MVRTLSNEQAMAAVYGAYFAKGYSFAVDMVEAIYPLMTMHMATTIMIELTRVAYMDGSKYVATGVLH